MHWVKEYFRLLPKGTHERRASPMASNHRHRKRMSPIDYLCAAYRLGAKLAPQIAVVLALAAILTYHAMTSRSLDWLLN